MNKIRVLTIIDTLGYGGAERLLVSLLPELQKQGVTCEVAVAHAPYSLMPELEQAGIKVHCLDISHRWAIPEAAYKLANICKQNQFDIIWGHLYFGNLYAAYTRLFIKSLKVVWTLHSTGYALIPPVSVWQNFRMKFEGMTAKYLVNTKVGVSNSVVNDYQQAFGWSMHRIYNGIPIDKLPPAINIKQQLQIRNSFGIPEKDFLITVPARYVEQKGHFVLCDALHILKVEKKWLPFCLCASQGYLKPIIQQRINDLELSNAIHLLDSLKQNKLFQLIQSSDAVVLPSLREPFGIAAAEAMALKTATILTNTDGFKEVVGDSKAALLVSPNNPRELANAIWKIYTDKALREKLSQEGKKRIAENFDIAVITAEWIKLFNNIKVRV
mgnify:CR=1 FL=1